MGAFDSELYSLGYRFKQAKPSHTPQKPKTYYVSWDGYGIGATGKHFNTIEEANQCYEERLEEGKRPNKWYKE